MQIKDKVAIVTGAAQGIGRAVSDAILQKGGKVVLSDLQDDVGKRTLEEFQVKYGKERVVFFKCDVTKKTEQKDLFRFADTTFGRIDIVCNNAGVIFKETLDTFDKMIDVNLKGVIIGSMIALEYMKKSGSGVIINTSSGAGLVPIPLINVYAACKYGIVGYTKSTAANLDLVGRNIRLNAVCPMLVNTQFAGMYADDREFSDVAEKYGVVEVPRVAEGHIRLIEDDTLNGTALMISQHNGFEFL